MAHDKHTANDEGIHPVSRKFMWLADERVVKGFIWLPVIGLVISIMGAIIYPFYKGHKAPWDFFASWAIFGFLAYSFVVLSAEPLFKWLSRPEDYYGEGSGDE